jgi:hypothetical protein
MTETQEVTQARKPGPKPKNPKLLRVPLFGRVRVETKQYLERLPGADNVGRAVDMIVELYREVSSPKRARRSR